jgi:dipeptidyl aminopeptidase/acylaminoacyl peptidase
MASTSASAFTPAPMAAKSTTMSWPPQSIFARALTSTPPASASGEAVTEAISLARNSNLFAAGVDFHGVHDWNLEDNAGDWKRGTNSQKDTLAAKALASSPLADLSHWTSPILLIHGDNDPDVAYAQTPTLADALRARNVPVQELIFPDEVHGFLLHKDWLAAYTAAAEFFERTLKP